MLPSVGIGLEFNAANFPWKIDTNVELTDAPVSGGHFSSHNRARSETQAAMMQWLATARYMITPDRNINPYLLGGIGINRFSATSNIMAATDDVNIGPGIVRLQPTSWTRDSIGAAVALGAGIQAKVLRDDIVAGVEARWNYSMIDSEKFGADSASYTAFYFWLGYKWTAPL